MRTKLITYLEAGGSVYFEGNDIGYNNNTYDIWDYTGLNYVGDGAAATTGNVQNISGDDFCAGMEFDYPWKSEADGYVDDFSVNGGIMLFNSQDDKGRIGCYTGPSNNYRTITSAIFFSVFEEDGTTRQELMAAYMNFLTEETGISEESSGAIVTASISNPSINSINTVVALRETSFCELHLYDITGRKLETVFSGSLSAGTHNLIFSTSEITSGTYFVSGTIGNETIQLRTILLK